MLKDYCEFPLWSAGATPAKLRNLFTSENKLLLSAVDDGYLFRERSFTSLSLVFICFLNATEAVLVETSR